MFDERAIAGFKIVMVNGVELGREAEKEESSKCWVDFVFVEKVVELTQKSAVKGVLVWCIAEEEVVEGFVWVMALAAVEGVCFGGLV